MSVKLNSRIIEGFVLAYLHSRFDSPAEIPDLHREMWDMACTDRQYVGWAAPRDFAKSTAITHSYSLATTVFGERDFGLILSGTWEMACKFLKDIKSEFYDNEELINDFGPIKFLKDTEDDIVVSCAAGIFCIMARGAEQDVRGLKWERKRPNFMIFDDAETDDQVNNPERRIKFRERILNVWLPMGSVDCKYLWVDTIKHYDAFLERIMNDSMWYTKRYKAHKSFDDFSELLWPAKWTEEKLRAKRQLFINQGNENGYSRELLNIPMTEKGAYFRIEDSLPMRDRDYENLEEEGKLTYLAAGDFAFSKTRRADYTVMGVAGIDSNGDICLVDVRRDRMASDEIVDEMISLTKRYDVQMFGVPSGKDFEAFRPFLESRMREEGTYVPIEIIPDAKDKPTKCQAFRGYHRMGMVRFDKNAEWWLTVDDEMRKFTMEGAKSGHDDIVDMLGVLGACIQKVSRPDTEEEENELEEYRIRREESHDDGRNFYTGY